MKKYWMATGLLALLLAVAASAFLLGSHVRRGHHARERPAGISLQGRTVIDLATALDLAAERLPGDVLKVELENEDDRYIYEIKVLADNGRVRKIKLDAQDGSLIEIEDD